MTITLQLLLYLVALVLLVLAGLGVSTRVHLGWFGLATWLFTAAVLPAF